MCASTVIALSSSPFRSANIYSAFPYCLHTYTQWPINAISNAFFDLYSTNLHSKDSGNPLESSSEEREKQNQATVKTPKTIQRQKQGMSFGNGEVHHQLPQGLEKRASADNTPFGSNKRFQCKLTSSPKNDHSSGSDGNLQDGEILKSPHGKDDGVHPTSCMHSKDRHELDEIDAVHYWAYVPTSTVSV